MRVDTRLALAYQGSLDQIAEERHRAARELGIAGRFLNPHKSPLGLGNYDVVVMESAVQAQGCQWQVVRRCVRAYACEHVRVGMCVRACACMCVCVCVRARVIPFSV